MRNKKRTYFLPERTIFAITITLFTIMSILLLQKINRQATFAEQANRTNLIRLYACQIQSKVQSLEAGQRALRLTGDSELAHNIRLIQKATDQDLSVLDSLTTGLDVHTRIDTLHRLVVKHRLITDSLVKLNNLNNPSDTHYTLLPATKVIDSIKIHTNKLAQNEMQLFLKEQVLKENLQFITPRFALTLILFTLLILILTYVKLDKQLLLSQTYLREKDKALNDLGEMNRIYSNAEEVANLGSWQWNLQTNLFKCSDNLFRIYGSLPRQEEISFERFLSFVLPEDQDTLVQGIQSVIQGKAPVEIRYRITKPDGTIRYMKATGKVMDESTERVMLGATQDVTEITEALQQLKASESFNRSIAELVPNVIYIFDLEKRSILYINTYPKDVLGFSFEEFSVAGFDFMQIIHPEDLPLIIERGNRFRHLKDKEVTALQYRIKNKTGEWISIYDRTTCFRRNEKGEVHQIIGVSTDMTEIRKANEKLSVLNKELAEKNKELQEMNTELSSFNFIASHDLQEPLRKIQTFSSFLEKNEPSLSESGKFYVHRMQQAAHQIRMLIQDVVSYHSTVSAEEWETVDLNEVLQTALQSLNKIALDKKALIKAVSLPIVQGNASQLQKLWEHLLMNAIKFSKPDTAPEITIDYKKNINNAISGLIPGALYHKISIADNGIGFEQIYANKIFDLFQRLHSKTDYEGRGVGLALCKKIVQGHRGAIQARSNPGEGAVFEIYLPV